MLFQFKSDELQQKIVARMIQNCYEKVEVCHTKVFFVNLQQSILLAFLTDKVQQADLVRYDVGVPLLDGIFWDRNQSPLIASCLRLKLENIVPLVSFGFHVLVRLVKQPQEFWTCQTMECDAVDITCGVQVYLEARSRGFGFVL